MAENHLDDNFIGINKAVFSDKKSTCYRDVVLKCFLNHELLHEAGMSPLEGEELSAWESMQFRESLETIADGYSKRRICLWRLL